MSTIIKNPAIYVTGGGITPTGNLNIQATQYRQTGIDVSDKATVSIDPAPTEVLTVSENGSYSPTQGKTFSSVDVNVFGLLGFQDRECIGLGLDNNMVVGEDSGKEILMFEVTDTIFVVFLAVAESIAPTHNIVLFRTELTAAEIREDPLSLIGKSATVLGTITPSDFTEYDFDGVTLYVAPKHILNMSDGDYILADTYYLADTSSPVNECVILIATN